MNDTIELIEDMVKKKKKVSRRKIFIVVFILLLMAVLISLSIYFFINRDKNEKEVTPVTVEEKKKEPVEKTTSFSFIGLGDALLHPAVYQDANTGKVGSDGYYIYDFHNMFSYVSDFIKPYDLKFYNQETIIGGKSRGLSGYPCFNSPDEIGLNLVDIGFNIVNLASNHTMDKGINAISYSTDFWQKQKGVLSVGSYKSKAQRDSIEIREVNGITYAVLSYTYGTNGIPVPSGYDYMVNVWPDDSRSAFEAYKPTVKRDVESVRDKVDVLMVSMHWGTEYQLGATNWYQQEAAKYLSSLGVDVIIGTHPHVVQPVEFVGDTLVIYSLGNMVSSQAINYDYSSYKKYYRLVGGVAAFTVNKKTVDGETKEISISDVKADVVYNYYSSSRTNFKIYPFTKLNNNILYNYKDVYEYYKKQLNPKGDSRIKVGFLE
ncbi:MAG: CapA family protein [Bacilli bacterium]|nr:CapA family protein [Bacilli bacterium]